MKTAYSMAMVGFLLVSISACTSNQYSSNLSNELIRGSVVRTGEQSIVVCFGADKAVEPGEIFRVQRVSYTGSIEEDNDSYRRENVGEIRILLPFDGHYARARIISGSVQPGDMIEQANDLR